MRCVLHGREKTLNAYLENEIATDYKGVQYYKTLTEDEKVEISKNMVSTLFESMKEKSMSIDYGDIEKSKGDIRRTKAFIPLQESIKFLTKMHSTSPNAPKEIGVLRNALSVIIARRRDFESAFLRGEEIKKMYYVNMVYTLIQSTSIMISTSVEYIQQNKYSNYEAHFKKSRDKSINDYLIKVLSNLIKMDGNGDLDNFFKNEEVINESMIPGSLLKSATVTILLTLFILKNIRVAILVFLRTRNNIASYVENMAYFVQNHAESLSADKKEIKEKQFKIVEKLRKLADKIMVDDKISQKNIERDIEQNNKEIKIDSKSSGIDFDFI